MGIGLGVLSEEELSEVVESGLFGLFGLVGNEVKSSSGNGGVDGGVFASFSMYVGNVEDGVSFGGTFVAFPLSFRVLSLLFWRGVNLDSSFSSLPWG